MLSQRRLRILLIAEACNPTWTSVPLVGYNLARALADRADLEITLATHVRNKPTLQADPIADLARLVFVDNEWLAGPLYHLARWLRGGNGLAWTTNTALAWPAYMAFERQLHRQLKAEFRRGVFDLVHRITPVSPTMGSPLARRIDVPMILGPLNGGLPWPREFPELAAQEREWLVPVRKLYRWLPGYRATYRHAAAVIGGSRHTLSELPDYFRGRRYYLPENGIDPARFSLDAPRGPVGPPFRFITVGRLVPYKGFDLILEAMAGSTVLRECELVIVGDGPQRASLEASIQANQLAHVRLAGWRTQTELADEMRQSQAFVFPSLREFGGGVVLEAMAAGLPSIVVEYGGPAELVDRACAVTVPMQPRGPLVQSLRVAMEQLAGNPQASAAMGECARERVRAEFTWSAKAEQILEIYHQVREALPCPATESATSASMC